MLRGPGQSAILSPGAGYFKLICATSPNRDADGV